MKEAVEVRDEGIISPSIQVSVRVTSIDISLDLFRNEARLQFLSVFGRDELKTPQGQEGRNKMSRRTHGSDIKAIARDKERLGLTVPQ